MASAILSGITGRPETAPRLATGRLIGKPPRRSVPLSVQRRLFSTLLARPGVCGQRRLLEEEGARVRQQDHLAALPG